MESPHLVIGSQTARDAHAHLSKVMPKKLSLMIAKATPIAIPLRYGEDLREGLIGIVIGQQVSTTAAHAIRQRVFGAFADRAALYQAAREQRLENLGLSAAKQRTVHQIAWLDDDQLVQWQLLPFALRLAAMTQMTGIGPWTVTMWSMFVCAEPDCWSHGDLILRTRMAAIAADCGRPVDAILADASPFQTYLALYIWAFKDRLLPLKTTP